jgi:hypothetical protein
MMNLKGSRRKGQTIPRQLPEVTDENREKQDRRIGGSTTIPTTSVASTGPNFVLNHVTLQGEKK